MAEDFDAGRTLARLEEATGALNALRTSHRGAFPIAFLGIAVTFIASAIAILYIITLSANLRQTKGDLARSNSELAAAREELRTARGTLQRVSAALPPGQRAEVEEALENVRRGEENLASITTTLRRVDNSLPDLGDGSDRWFAVIASYNGSHVGLERAQERLRALDVDGVCAEIWLTRLSNTYALVINGVSDEAASRAAVANAKQRGIAPDAYAQMDRQWIFVGRSASCARPPGPA